jgi:hypothetical protein
MVNEPAGITTISGQSGHSRNTAPGLDVTGSFAFTSTTSGAVDAKINTADSNKIGISFIKVSHLRR